MRIAFAGITQEGLGASPIRTRLEDFRVVRGEPLLDDAPYQLRQVCERLGVEPVPILAATNISPGGAVESGAYLQLRDELVSGLKAAGTLDGVCLLLHGAMLVEDIWSGEADLVREIRAVVGDEVRLSARLDLHANLSAEFIHHVDVLTGFRTAPHRDAVETTHRALQMLVEVIRSKTRPNAVLVPVPLLLQGEKATTDVEPMRSLEAMAREIEQEPGILNTEVFVGFGWADSPNAGSSVVVIAESREHLARAESHAVRLGQAMWDSRREFGFDQEVAGTVDEALDLALAAQEPSVWLTDSGDNPTAGTPGDSTYFLRRTLERRVTDVVFASIPDESAWRVCATAGVGATVELDLGANWDTLNSGPVHVRGIVDHVFDGDIEKKISPMATLNVDGVRVVKLGYLMPELRDAAPREILVLTPGYSDMQLERLTYQHVTRPIFPLDRDFAWRPAERN
jgi:microcystin degradation protein MlrC